MNSSYQFYSAKAPDSKCSNDAQVAQFQLHKFLVSPEEDRRWTDSNGIALLCVVMRKQTTDYLHRLLLIILVHSLQFIKVADEL